MIREDIKKNIEKAILSIDGFNIEFSNVEINIELPKIKIVEIRKPRYTSPFIIGLNGNP